MQFLKLASLALATLSTTVVADYSMYITNAGRITRFESTLLVPAVSPTHNHTSFFEITTALGEPHPTSLLASLVSSEDGSWKSVPVWIGTPINYLTPNLPILPGIAQTSLFTLDIIKHLWQYAFSLQNGGSPANATSQYGGASWDPKPVNISDLTGVFFYIANPGDAQWDIGPVVFSNVIIQGDNLDPEALWCSSPTISGNLKVDYTQPIATRVGETIVCYIAQITMEPAQPAGTPPPKV